MRRSPQVLSIGLIAVLFVSTCKKNTTINYDAYTGITNVPDDDHLLLGNPSNAATTTDSTNNYLMIKPYYDLSYNSTRGIPNWVSWHLSISDLGNVSRQNNFQPDTTLPAYWYQVTSDSYTGNGFDRGHNCPSGDRTVSDASDAATFLMTNIIPQAPFNNENTWAQMEDSIRTYIWSGNEAFIVMGSYGTGGSGDDGYAATIDNGHVTVPAKIWKVVVLIANGNNDLSRIDTTARVIAVIVPNNNNVSSDWKSYRTTVDAIEAATGYNLLSNVPSAIQDVLGARVDDK
jgi:endonuclease G